MTTRINGETLWRRSRECIPPGVNSHYKLTPDDDDDDDGLPDDWTTDYLRLPLEPRFDAARLRVLEGARR